jgi:hypothetical protein
MTLLVIMSRKTVTFEWTEDLELIAAMQAMRSIDLEIPQTSL